MTWLVQFLDDAYLDEIAQFYAAAPPRTRAADTGAAELTPESRAIAQTLVEQGDIAHKIAPEDIRAVAVWLSQQSHADEQRPAPAGSFVPPKACGSSSHAQDAR